MPDGSIITAGCESTSQISVVKYDPSGNVLWAYGYTSTSGFNAPNKSKFLTSDAAGNIIIGAENTLMAPAHSYLLKLDSAGNVVYYKSYEAVGSIAHPLDFDNIAVRFDRYFITGNTDSSAVFCIRAVNGNVMWAKNYTGYLIGPTDISGITFRNNEMLLSGLTRNFDQSTYGPNSFPILIKADTMGVVNDAFVFADPINNYFDDVLYHKVELSQNSSGHLLLYSSPEYGYYGATQGPAPFMVISPNNSVIWSSGIPDVYDNTYITGILENNNDVILGYAYSPFSQPSLCKFSNNGQLLYNAQILSSNFIPPYQYLNKYDSTTFVYSFSKYNGSGSYSYIIKDSIHTAQCDSSMAMTPAPYAPTIIPVLYPISHSFVTVTPTTITAQKTPLAITPVSYCQANSIDEMWNQGEDVYPNPSSGILIIPDQLFHSSLLIKDISGRTIFSTSSIETYHLDLEYLPSGSYILQFLKDNKMIQSKWIKM